MPEHKCLAWLKARGIYGTQVLGLIWLAVMGGTGLVLYRWLIHPLQ